MKNEMIDYKIDFRVTENVYKIMKKYADQKFIKVGPLCRIIIMEHLQEKGLLK